MDTGCAEVILAAVHFSPLSARMEPDGRTQVLPTHKELFVQPVVAVYVDVKTKARKKSLDLAQQSPGACSLSHLQM